MQLKSLPFFQLTAVTDPASSAPPKWMQNRDITCSSSGKQQVYFGDSEGFIIAVNHALAITLSFQAHPKKITHMRWMRRRNMLITIGNDESDSPMIKVWNMDKLDKFTRVPSLSRSTKVLSGNKVFPVTCFAVLENMTQFAIGFENGVVLLLRGDVSRDRFTKQKIIHEGSSSITGLGFHENGKSTALYVVTLAEILVVDTSGKDFKKIVVEEQGCDFGCAIATTNEQNQEMVIGRREAIYFYGIEGRGPCSIINSEKVLITWFKHYIVVISKEKKKGAADSIHLSLTDIHQNGTNGELSDTSGGTTLSIYDLKNKYIAYSGVISASDDEKAELGGIVTIVSEWGQIYVVTKTRRLYRLEEKDLTAKLEILFKNNLYSLAINIVASLQSKAPTQSVLRESASTDNFAIIDDLSNSGDYDYGTIVEIYRRYGDWLYSKGDYDSAMQQYLRTIGRLEPSYVIRKFLDAQRIHNLTSYLQLLHEKGLGNSDHTTLLLNCYTKLRDVKKLDEFIKSNSSDSQEWTFDVHTAISVCRSAGYHQHALYLAKKYSQHEWVMKIQIEDLKEYTQTVDYLSKLPSAESERELKKYGYVLVTEMPVETTKIFVELCTRTSEPKFLESGDGAPISHDDDAPLSSSITSSSESEIYPEDLIPLYVHQPQWCIRFLEKILERKWGIVLASRDKGKVAAKNHSTSSSDVLSELSPRDQVSCTIACNTLLELYLSQLSSSENYGFSKEALVMELLKHPRAAYDIHHALVLCKMHKFYSGVLYIDERTQSYKDIAQFHMEQSSYSSVIDACKTYGEKDPSLWVSALSYFAEKSSLLESGHSVETTRQMLQVVLDNIEKKNLLPPLQVIQVLSKNSSITIGTIKDYLIRRITSEKKLIEEDRKIINNYEQETEKMRQRLSELRNSPIVFQASKCDNCSRPLELPTVHFLCKHSYHQRCLGDSDQECPKCGPDHELVREIIANHEENANNHELFMDQLEVKTVDEKFKFISASFAKNVF